MKNARPKTVKKLTRQSIIEKVKRIAKDSGTSVTREEFIKRTGITGSRILWLFPEGGWLEVLKLAGLPPHPRLRRFLPDETLLQEYHRVASSLGRIPTWQSFSSRSKFRFRTYRCRFGNTRRILERYLDYLMKNAPDSPLVKLTRARLMYESEPTDMERDESPTSFYFQGMQHPPENEQGVALLFGMVCHRLGFIVQSVGISYPDCIAKRRISRNRSQPRWRVVRVEFEYTSLRFREHKHDPAKCDVIVCWEHNWPTCPIEVIELSSVIKHLTYA
jgi:hypothetical protein